MGRRISRLAGPALLLAASAAAAQTRGARQPPRAPRPTWSPDQPLADWTDIAPADLMIFDFAGGRQVIVQLAPDFAPDHIDNIKKIARAGPLEQGDHLSRRRQLGHPMGRGRGRAGTLSATAQGRQGTARGGIYPVRGGAYACCRPARPIPIRRCRPSPAAGRSRCTPTAGSTSPSAMARSGLRAGPRPTPGRAANCSRSSARRRAGSIAILPRSAG